MDPRKVTYEIARAYLLDHAATFGDFYLTIEGWLRSRSFQKLATCADLMKDCEVLSVPLVRSLLQMEAFFKKNSSFTDDVVAHSAAMTAFLRSEQQCRETNLRLDDFYANPGDFPEMYETIWRMSDFISAVLGPFETFLEKIPELVKVTSGATKTRSRRVAQPHRKLSMRVSCTPRVAPYVSAVYRYFGYRAPRCKYDYFNRVEFVPKNWKTKRTIACEPDGNLPFQLAFDSYVKPLLKYWGCNLSDQSQNQRLAKFGSESGVLATIDLSSASDTAAVNTVYLLFPEKWADYLFACRSPGYTLGDKQYLYEKFASMGNGSTFTVETLIFLAAARASGSSVTSVYGDDIIVTSDAVPRLTEILSFLGFTVNPDKSHVNSDYTESCGAHWFRGSDVTPVYLREIDKRKPILSHVVNTLASVGGEHLWALLKNLVFDNGLQMIPFDGNSTSGVWIHVHDAYAKRLIFTHHSCQFIRRYLPKVRKGHCSSIQGLTLWFLRTFKRINLKTGGEIVTSGYPTESHKYVLRWANWIPPVAATPDHLCGWSEYLIR